MNATDQFLSYLISDRGYSDETIKVYGDALRSLETYYTGMEASLTWADIDTDIIRSWMVHLMDRGQNPRTVAKELSAVRTFYKYLMRMGKVATNPARLISNPKADKPLPVFLKKTEVDRLFDDITFPPTPEGRRDRTILLTFYHTGIRLSELIGLNIADIDTKGGELKVTGKRNKQRIVPFGREAIEALSTYIALRTDEQGAEPHSPLFVTDKGARMNKGQVQKVVRSYLSLVTTQKKKSPHVLRHTFATQMLNGGADLEAIKELLGHESIATTEIYTHTTFADLKREYQHAHPRA